MPNLYRSRLLAAMAMMTFMAGCGKSTAPDTLSTAPVAATQSAAFASAPWLRQHLPEDTFAYLRVPSLWGLLSAPNQRGADAMYGNATHDQVIAQLRHALAHNVITADLVGTETADRVLQALSSLQAPVEIAITAPGKVASPAATALISTAFDTRDPEAVSALLDGLLAGSGIPPLRFDADGWAQFASPHGGSAVAHFDRESGRLNLIAGMGVARAPLQALLERARDNGPTAHALHALEQEIDAGGQGLLLWMDMQSVKPFLLAGLTSDTMPMRHVAEQTQAIAMGWGGVNGHGRLSLRAQLKDPTWMRYLPQAPRTFDLKSVGEPTSVITLAMPTAQDLDRIIAAVSEDFGPAMRERWDEFEAGNRKDTGLSLRDWLAPYDNELLLFDDDAGGFTAVRLRDRAALKTNIDQLVDQGAEHTVRAVDGTDIHHLRLRWQADDAVDTSSSTGAALAAWFFGQPMHLYWIEDGDWQITSSVPQPLIDRIAMKASQPVDAWLRDRHGDDRSRALVSVSTRIDGVPRKVYGYYLSLLALLGDLANSPVDLFALPTARQLGLPGRTGVGLQLIASEERAGFDLNFQSTPLDGLMSGTGVYGAVAVVAILAAIAVPAYQDYKNRKLVTLALFGTHRLQAEVIKHFATHGKLPREAELTVQQDEASYAALTPVHFQSNGTITIFFDEHAAAGLRHRQLALIPHRTPDGTLTYVCGLAPPPRGAHPLPGTFDAAVATTLPSRTLPAHCQAQR